MRPIYPSDLASERRLFSLFVSAACLLAFLGVLFWCLVASAATPKKHCTSACYVDRDPVVCIYDEADRCDRGECVPDAHTICEPRIKNLGEWNPVVNPSSSVRRGWWR